MTPEIHTSTLAFFRQLNAEEREQTARREAAHKLACRDAQQRRERDKQSMKAALSEMAKG
jgi:hypothetical protein